MSNLFGRKAVPITDGHSSLNRHLTILKAEVLKKDGVFIYVIAMGSVLMSGIDEVMVASWPPQYYLF